MKRFRETNYYVTEDGKIYSSLKDLYLKPSLSKNGYYRVTIYVNNKREYYNIHRMVAECFIGKPTNNIQVNHKDCNKTNNHFLNLEYCSGIENMKHAYINNLVTPTNGELNGMSKLTKTDVLNIRNEYKNTKVTYKQLAEKYNITTSTVYKVIKNIIWKHVK